MQSTGKSQTEELTVDGLYAHLENLVRICQTVRACQKDYFKTKDKEVLIAAKVAESALDFWLVKYKDFFINTPPQDPAKYLEISNKIESLKRFSPVK